MRPPTPTPPPLLQLTVHLPGLGPVVEDEMQQAAVPHGGGHYAGLFQQLQGGRKVCGGVGSQPHAPTR